MIKKVKFAKNLAVWCVKNSRIFLTKAPNVSLTIISASDRTHQRSLRNLLRSLCRFEPTAKVIIYDLGMDNSFLEKLRDEFKSVEFKSFPYEKYPSHYDIRVNAGLYAWKPAALKESKPFPQFVVWFDAGNVVTGRLIFLRKCLKQYGFFSPYSAGKIEEWTSPATLKALQLETQFYQSRNLSANVVAFDAQDDRALDLVNQWIHASEVKDLIAPPGSSRDNHRQDQSLLTVLAYNFDMVNYGSLGEFPRRIFKVLVHQDVD